MYRQVLILPEYRTFQHVFWRSSPLDKLVEYELDTVTYGTNCAPFLALRVLKSIALDDCVSSDAVRDALLNQTYVDDVCAGADSIADVLRLQSELISILERAGMQLKKWSSNESDVLHAVLADYRVNCPQPFDTDDKCGIKVLGLQWHPTENIFSYALRLDLPIMYTKRGLLSLIARIFDPLGLFAPAVFYAAFLASFDRFVARRGLPSDIFSDCGTNFVGADRQLNKLINSPEGQSALGDSHPHCAWHFNPPSAPHFGGLWEAAVRFTKRLLIRVMGNHHFSYEEFTTVLCRVEAIINSRPLTPLSSDPADLDYLSPEHFLIGQPLLAVPPRTSTEDKSSLVNRWKLLNQCHQSFWKQWSNEYLTTLQARTKWSTGVPHVRLNDVVVIRDNQSPPLSWRIGLLIALLPGPDRVVRMVRLRTAHGEVTRPVVKVVVLPTEETRPGTSC